MMKNEIIKIEPGTNYYLMINRFGETMSKKFTVPQKFLKLGKTDPNIKELIEWYEEKLAIMEHRQKSLSEKLSKAHEN